MPDFPQMLRKRLRLSSLLRVFLPSLATLIVIALLVFTIFFTALEWQWIAFLSGILCAAVLSLVSASWKSSWRLARRTAEAARFRERLTVESGQHGQTRERLDRELALHQQDREGLSREIEARRQAEERKRSVENMLRILGVSLREIAAVVDSDRRYRFHTRAFAAWVGSHSTAIDGHTFEEPLRSSVADALRTSLDDALLGHRGQIEIAVTEPAGATTAFAVELAPQFSSTHQVTSVVLLVKDGKPSAQPGTAEPGSEVSIQAHMKEPAPAPVPIPASTNGGGNAAYLNSLTDELTGWGDPRTRIREAIDREEFDLYSQEIIALHPGAIPASMQELLIRMRDEERNLVPPGAFLPVAERFGMMPEIDRFVVRKAGAACSTWTAARRERSPVLCINLARATLEDQSFPDSVAQILDLHKIRGENFCFEFEDPDLVACPADATRTAQELKRLGCCLSLDGFGAIDVRFDHVRSLPLDFVKIDGRIIYQVDRDPVAVAMVRAIQRASEAIGVRTIAMMVESAETLGKLRSLGVNYAQGFGIAKPRPMDHPE